MRPSKRLTVSQELTVYVIIANYRMGGSGFENGREKNDCYRCLRSRFGRRAVLMKPWTPRAPSPPSEKYGFKGQAYLSRAGKDPVSPSNEFFALSGESSSGVVFVQPDSHLAWRTLETV